MIMHGVPVVTFRPAERRTCSARVRTRRPSSLDDTGADAPTSSRSPFSMAPVVDVKLLLFTVLAGYVASVGHALLFAVGVEPPHDGVRRRGVSICGATLQALNLQVQA